MNNSSRLVFPWRDTLRGHALSCVNEDILEFARYVEPKYDI